MIPMCVCFCVTVPLGHMSGCDLNHLAIVTVLKSVQAAG